MQNLTAKFIPITILQMKVFSISDRVMLCMSMFADKDGVCWMQWKTMALLIGMAESEEDLTDMDNQAIKNARHTLMHPTYSKSGEVLRPAYLKHVTKLSEGGYEMDAWELVHPDMTQVALAKMTAMTSRNKEPITYHQPGTLPNSSKANKVEGTKAAPVVDWEKELGFE